MFTIIIAHKGLPLSSLNEHYIAHERLPFLVWMTIVESGWNLWVWLLGVVLRRYIDFLILLIPTPLVSVLFGSSIPTFLFIFLNVFRSCSSTFFKLNFRY